MDTYVNGYGGGYSSGLEALYNNELFVILFFILGIITLVVLVISIIGIIGQWKMFKKAGKKGWEAIIPIYNVYTLCLITGINPVWILIVFGLGFVVIFFPILSFASSLSIIYFGILLAVSTARSYGKGDGYALGLYFLAPFFQLALGLDKSKYLGPKPMADIILKDKSSVKNATSTTTQEAEVKQEQESTLGEVQYCSHCGTKLVIDSKYCSNCGKEL